MSTTLRLVAFAAALSLGGAATANIDAGLYDPAPPADSAFVRVVNAKGDGAPVGAVVGARNFGQVASGQASVYWAIKAGAVPAKMGAAATRLQLMPGRFYTVAVQGKTGGERALTIQDPKLESRARSLIALYNLTGRPLVDLRTPDGKQAVVANIAPGRVGNRAVGAASSAFAVTAGGKPIATVTKQTVARGAPYSVVVTEVAGKTRAVWTPSRTRVR